MFVKKQQQQEQPVQQYSGEGVNQQYQQNFRNNFQSLGPDQIEQYKKQEHNHYFKIAQVKGASCRLPGTCETIIDLLQLGLLIGIFILTDYWITEYNQFPFPFISLYIFYLILTLCKMCGGSPLGYIKNAKTREELEIYADQMQNSPPIIQYYAEAFHYVTRRTKNGSSRSKRVTWSSHEKLIYTRCEDKTDDLALLMRSSKILRLNTKFSWFKGNELARQNFELLCQAQNIKASQMDSYHNGHDSSKMEGQIGQQLAFNSSIPCYLDKPVFWFFYLFGLSIFIDTFFYSVTGECTYKVQKVVYCDLFQGAQIQQMMFQPMNQQQIQIGMQQQPMMGQQMQMQPMQPMQMQPMYPMQMQQPGAQPLQIQQGNMYAQPGMQPMQQQPQQINQQY